MIWVVEYMDIELGRELMLECFKCSIVHSAIEEMGDREGQSKLEAKNPKFILAFISYCIIGGNQEAACV